MAKVSNGFLVHFLKGFFLLLPLQTLNRSQSLEDYSATADALVTDINGYIEAAKQNPQVIIILQLARYSELVFRVLYETTSTCISFKDFTVH